MHGTSAFIVPGPSTLYGHHEQQRFRAPSWAATTSSSSSIAVHQHHKSRRCGLPVIRISSSDEVEAASQVAVECITSITKEQQVKDVFTAHGRHICLDYTNFYVEARHGAELTLRLIREAVREAGVREVHSKVVVLGEDGLSPPGFTGVCLIDESHVTSHCYSDRGWLAIDVFTCGAHPPEV